MNLPVTGRGGDERTVKLHETSEQGARARARKFSARATSARVSILSTETTVVSPELAEAFISLEHVAISQELGLGEAPFCSLSREQVQGLPPSRRGAVERTDATVEIATRETDAMLKRRRRRRRHGGGPLRPKCAEVQHEL